METKKYQFQRERERERSEKGRRERSEKGREREVKREEREKRETINSETREILHTFFAYFLNTDSEKFRKKRKKKVIKTCPMNDQSSRKRRISFLSISVPRFLLFLSFSLSLFRLKRVSSQLQYLVGLKF